MFKFNFFVFQQTKIEYRILQGQITIPHLDLYENELNQKLTKDLSDFLEVEKKKMDMNWVKSNATQKSIIDSKSKY